MADLTRPQIALQFFQRSLGLTPAQAAGLVGNLQQESGPNLNPTLLGDNGASFGVFQHQGPRRQALNAFAAERGKDPSDFQTQLEFAANEFRTTERRAFDRLRAARTPEEAARAAVSFFRPSDPRTENRIRNAVRLAGGSTAPTARTVRTIPVGPQSQPMAATAAPAAAPAAAAPTVPPTPPAGLLASPGGSQTMANGTQPEQGGVGGFVQGLLADPTFNLGIGLLAASGPSTTPVSLGQALASGVQFASRREQEAAKNEISRQQLLARQQQQQARERLRQNPGLLGLTPEQGERFGLLAEAFPQQAGGLLAQVFGPQRRPNSLIEQAQFAFPNDPEKQRQFVVESVQKAGGTNADLDRLIKIMTARKLEREEATATRTEAEERGAAKAAIPTLVKHLIEAADINARLENSYARTGTGLETINRIGVGGGAAIARLFGQDTEEADRVAADFDRFRKLSSEIILQEAGRMSGQATNQLREFIQNRTFGTGIAPDANRKVIADGLEQALAAADRMGVAIPDRDKVEARIQQLRGGDAVEGRGGAAAAPAATPSSTEAETGPRRFSTEAAARRAFERGRIKAGDEVIVNGRRFIVRDQ